MRPPLCTPPAALSVEHRMFRCGNNGTEILHCTNQKRPGGSKGWCSAQRINNGNDCRGQSYHNSTAWPVAVPDIFLGFEKPSSAIDRCHSLPSLLPPPAAVGSLPLSRLLSCLSCRNKKDTRRRQYSLVINTKGVLRFAIPLWFISSSFPTPHGQHPARPASCWSRCPGRPPGHSAAPGR